MNFSVEGPVIYFKGDLIEESDFEDVVEAIKLLSENQSRVRLDFLSVKRGNSIGILSWIKAAKASNVPLVYESVPVWLVEQMNMILDFFQMDAIVSSFAARYYNEQEDENSIQFLKVGDDIVFQEDYQDEDLEYVDEAGVKYEPDFIPETYLGFLKYAAKDSEE